MTMDATDRAILNRMQDDLPLTAHPFASVAARNLGLPKTNS